MSQQWPGERRLWQQAASSPTELLRTRILPAQQAADASRPAAARPKQESGPGIFIFLAIVTVVVIVIVYLAYSASGGGRSPAKAAAAPRAARLSASASCTLKTTFDYIERDDSPGASVLADVAGNVDYHYRGKCAPTLSSFAATAGRAPGECTTIALASDNPGYDASAIPAPPLKHVIKSAGPGCQPASSQGRAR
jgi:hypothetical protein